MTGKLFGILLMALAAILAWKWLRGSSPRPPAPRAGDTGQHGSDGRDNTDARTIELERDADGVYRPKNSRNDKDGTQP